MKKIHYIYTITFILGLSSLMYPQKVATTSLQFLKVMPTAQATGMADAFTSVVSGVDAVFWNPAGITKIDGQALSSTVTLWLLDTKQSAVAYGYSLGNLGSIAAQFQYVDYGSIKETRVDYLFFSGSGNSTVYNPGVTGRTFSPKAYLFGLTYARALTENFSTGLTVKYVHESLYDQATVDVANPIGGVDNFNTAADVILMDFGIQYNTGYKSVVLGVSVQNFGSSVKFGKEAYPAPLMFRLGTSANLIGLNSIAMTNSDNRLTISYDIFQPNDYAQQMHTGLEYGFQEMFFLRSGYKYNYDYEKFSFGAGFAGVLSGFGLKIDYSYAGMGEYLGNVHRISLGVSL